jgi:hypothetical protein
MAGSSFHDAFSVTRLYSVDDMVINKLWWTWEELVGSVRGLILHLQLHFIIHYILILLYFIHILIIVRKKIAEPYIDVLVYFTTDDGQNVGRNACGLWPIKVFKSSWFLLYFSNFKVLSQHSPGRTNENHGKNSFKIAGRRDQDLNPGLSEYEAGVLTTRPRRSIEFLSKWNLFL